MARATELSPAQLLSLTIALLIALGTALLSLAPASTREPLALIDAFFTSASAVCVTGLIVVDTPRDLSMFGQIVVLLLIQAGGLGYMAITTIVSVALGRQLSVHERLTLQEALNVQTMEGLIRFVGTVLKLTLAFELAGAALLAGWWAGELGAGRALYYGLFHSVSAFNNAGFSLFSDSLIGYRGDWFVNLVILALIVCGGLGFVVLADLGRLRATRRLSVHTRLVLSVTAALIGLATTAVFIIERQNPHSLGPLDASEALLAALFQAVTPRTAGFNTVNIGAMMPATLFMLMILMFIGAAPGGTAGGVKITTFSITVAALWATVRGQTEPSIFRRRLAPALVARSFFISLIAFLALNAIAGLLLITEERELLPTLFETTSAFGTVGLSTGSTAAPELSLAGDFTPMGKFLLAAMMFMGRVGPLTLAVALAQRGTRPRLRYPEGKIFVG